MSFIPEYALFQGKTKLKLFFKIYIRQNISNNQHNVKNYEIKGNMFRMIILKERTKFNKFNLFPLF